MLAFCSFGIATLQAHPDFGADLLTFMGTVARLARDHHSPAWATYEQAFRAKVAANPSVCWNCLDQEVWALAIVPSTTSTPLPQKCTSLNSKTTCNRWNEDRPCPFKVCRYLHACAGCLSPTLQRVPLLLPNAPKVVPNNLLLLCYKVTNLSTQGLSTYCKHNMLISHSIFPHLYPHTPPPPHYNKCTSHIFTHHLPHLYLESYVFSRVLNNCSS